MIGMQYSVREQRLHIARDPPRYVHRYRVAKLLVTHTIFGSLYRSPTIWKALQALAFDRRQLPDN